MLFNSLHFLLFFLIVTILYFTLPHRIRWALLLAGSCYFYMAFKPIYILILAFTILIDYIAARFIEIAPPNRKKLYLTLSICANVGVLAIFKYYNFLNSILQDLLRPLSITNPFPALTILLPIGLSFHTFQSLSYTIEVYRGKCRAERNFGIFALYVMFYPQLVAGPIERPQNLLWQFYKPHQFDYHRVVAGLQMMLLGFFKKVMIADRVAPMVNQVYDHPYEYQGISYLIATFWFAIQIYCDFSGYSDIAIGSAQVMGFRLMNNFERPYFSKSISEFWKRWHISLSSWFSDYFYIGLLGGNRVARHRWFFNLFFTFLVSGLWHGANWTYILWGCLNGTYLILEIVLGKWWSKTRAPFRIASSGDWAWVGKAAGLFLTFSLICFSWIFFRARTVAEAWHIATHLFDGLLQLPRALKAPGFIGDSIALRHESDIPIAVVCLAILLLIELFQGQNTFSGFLQRRPTWFRWVVYYAGIIGLLFFGAFNHSHDFIYFQF